MAVFNNRLTKIPEDFTLALTGRGPMFPEAREPDGGVGGGGWRGERGLAQRAAAGCHTASPAFAK